MSPYDVTPDDQPLDVAAVTADDRVVEQLRRSLSPDAAVIWDDEDDADDPAFALLRTLQLDVSDDLPLGQVLPREVTPLLPRQRRLGRGATLAAVAAGVLSLGGVAAAATPGHPLAGVRAAVTSAVTSVVDAITPDAPVGPKPAEARKTNRPAAKPATPRGEATAAAVRSASAERQVRQNLAKAADFLAAGKDAAAAEQLDAAERKLHLVTDPSTRAKLAAELAALRSRLAVPHPARSQGAPADKGSSDGKGGGKGPDGRDSGKKGVSSSGKGTGAGQRTAGQSGDGQSGDGQSVRHTPAPAPTHDVRSGKTSTTDVRSPLPKVDGKASTGNRS